MANLKRVYDGLPAWAQSLSISLAGWQHARKMYGHTYRAHRAFLEDYQWWSRERQNEYQNQQVADLVEHAARTVPYYRETLRERGLTPADITTVADLRKLPFLFKATVRARGDDLRSSAYGPRQVRPKVTSGTTGSALHLWWGKDTYEKQYANWRLHRAWLGIEPADRVVVCDGHAIMPVSRTTPPFYRCNWPEHTIYFSALHLNPGTISHYVAALEKIQPALIFGYPSLVCPLASAVAASGAQVRPKAVCCGSETILPWHEEIVLRGFGVPIRGSYGNGELAGCAIQCPEGTYHCQTAHSVHEVLNEEDQPCKPGEAGRLVATTLLNRAMPLIRYETRDVVVLGEGTCACERPGQTFRRIDGRNEDYVVTKQGSAISASVLTFLFKTTPEIREAQIRQDALGEVVIRVVPAEGFSPAVLDKVHKLAAERMGSDTEVRFQVEEQIEREPNGKFRFVKSSVASSEAVARALGGS